MPAILKGSRRTVDERQPEASLIHREVRKAQNLEQVGHLVSRGSGSRLTTRWRRRIEPARAGSSSKRHERMVLVSGAHGRETENLEEGKTEEGSGCHDD
jgi:hypothetical protein